MRGGMNEIIRRVEDGLAEFEQRRRVLAQFPLSVRYPDCPPELVLALADLFPASSDTYRIIVDGRVVDDQDLHAFSGDQGVEVEICYIDPPSEEVMEITQFMRRFS